MCLFICWKNSFILCLIRKNLKKKSVCLTVNQQWSGGDLVAAVLIGKCGRLLDRREVLGGGRCVYVSNLDPGRWRGLNVALRWKKRERLYPLNKTVDGILTEHSNIKSVVDETEHKLGLQCCCRSLSFQSLCIILYTDN